MASSAENVGPVESNGVKRSAETPLRSAEASRGNSNFKNKRMRKAEKPKQQLLKTTGSNEEVLLLDVQSLLSRITLDGESTTEKDGNAKPMLPERLSQIEVTVKEISSTGDGLAISKDNNHVYVVPFTAPGDKVLARPYRHLEKEKYSLADLVKVEEASSVRDDSLIKCPYFATCSGCQFQMLPYDYQLAHKKTIVEKAYKNFSNLPPELMPQVGDTIGSPLQYGYRTKLTPHFDGPPDARRSDGRKGIKRSFKHVPPIGFMKKGTRDTIDIEDCPIGTEAVRLGMKKERKRVTDELGKYSRGATLLLRETTKKIAASEAVDELDPYTVVEEKDGFKYLKSCVTDNNSQSTEYISDFQFSNPAGAFFQNNNSILVPFTQYIRQHILPPPTNSSGPKISHLIDAYSGSGLFTITLSDLFKTSLGIDIAASSIKSATHNAELNNLPPSQARFIAADAAELFASIETPAAETVVVIDPPRKGCDESFLRQLVAYGPARVVYVSCNVHTQARDVGVLVGGLKGVDGGCGVGVGCYEIESVRGFDFFPQTGHVEGVAVLKRKESVQTESVSAKEKSEEKQVGGKVGDIEG
jgi:tRNA (uracil-5-)-methyltransferase